MAVDFDIVYLKNKESIVNTQWTENIRDTKILLDTHTNVTVQKICNNFKYNLFMNADNRVIILHSVV